MCRGKQLDCYIAQDHFTLHKALGSGDRDVWLHPELKSIFWAGTSGAHKYLLVKQDCGVRFGSAQR